MRREAKKRKFNEAVISMLFPSSPPQTEDTDGIDKQEQHSTALRQHVSLPDVLAADDIEDTVCHFRRDDDEEEEDGEGEFEKQKLSRAQRKRIRKKKLKEESIRRGNMIGPLLPVDREYDSGGGEERVERIGSVRVEEPPCVRGNAKLRAHDEAGKSKEGHAPAVHNNKKLKQRRMAKRLAQDGLNSSSRQE